MKEEDKKTLVKALDESARIKGYESLDASLLRVIMTMKPAKPAQP